MLVGLLRVPYMQRAIVTAAYKELIRREGSTKLPTLPLKDGLWRLCAMEALRVEGKVCKGCAKKH